MRLFEICLVALFVTVVLLAGAVVGIIIDTYSSAEIGEKEGVVVMKYERQPYTTTIIVGKILTIQPHPHTYNLEVQVGKRVGTLAVEEGLYRSLLVGDILTVRCSIGRWSKKLRIKEITRIGHAGGHNPPALYLYYSNTIISQANDIIFTTKKSWSGS